MRFDEPGMRYGEKRFIFIALHHFSAFCAISAAAVPAAALFVETAEHVGNVSQAEALTRKVSW